MIILSNTTEQTLLVGQSITFDSVPLHTGCAECHRANSNSVVLRWDGIYEIYFGANIGGTVAATAVQLSIETGGSPLPETLMVSTPTAVDDLNNVSKKTAVKTCAGYDQITVTNTGTSDVVVGAGSCLFIRRIA